MGLARRAVGPLAGALLSAGLLLDTRGLDQVARGDQLGPGFWPRLALSGLLVTCVVKCATEWWRQRAADPSELTRVDAEPTRVDAPEAGTPPEMSPRKLATAIGLILLYVLATPAVGFPLATVAFIAAFLYLGGTRSVAALGINAVIGTIFLLYLFIKLVYLPLPKGDGPFEAVSLLLYRTLGIF